MNIIPAWRRGIPLVALVLPLAGCPGPNRFSQHDVVCGIDKDQALAIATQLAYQSGFEVKEYTLRPVRDAEGWVVLFRRLEPRPYFGGDDHFSVVIDTDGSAHLHSGE